MDFFLEMAFCCFFKGFYVLFLVICITFFLTFSTFPAMNIEDWRTRIDELNVELISLLNKRASFAHEIGKLKKQAGLPVLDQGREGQVLDSVEEIAKNQEGCLNPQSVKRIFQVIMEETRKVEDL